MATAAENKGAGAFQAVTRTVVCTGRTPIMFDRYAGDNATTLEPHQKFYFDADGKTICLPTENVMSFLSAENTMSAPKRIFGKKAKQIALDCLSFVSIEPQMIPLLRDGKPIKFGAFENVDGVLKDKLSGAFVHRCVARLKGGIPNPKVRPVIPLPWSVAMRVTIFENPSLSEQIVRTLFEKGGFIIGFGTFRGVFGKFSVSRWE